MSSKLRQQKHRYEFYTLNRKKLEFVGVGPGSIIPKADPRIQIRIKMKRIRNTVRYLLSFIKSFKSSKFLVLKVLKWQRTILLFCL